jgi:hypothetical protein
MQHKQWGENEKGRKAGTMGDVGFFSMDRGKALSTVEGGIILTNSDKIGNALRIQLDKIQEYSVTEQFVSGTIRSSLVCTFPPLALLDSQNAAVSGVGRDPF